MRSFEFQENRSGSAQTNDKPSKKRTHGPVDQHKMQPASGQKSLSGILALYTWGFLATASVVFAGMFIVTEVRIKQSWEVVNAEVSKAYQVASAPVVKRLVNPSRLTARRTQSQTFDVAALVPSPKIDHQTTASIGKSQNRIKFAGFGANIGTTSDPKLLADRYLAVSNTAPELFFGIIPKFKKPANKLDKNTKLIVGPFLSEKESEKFCKAINARMALDCSLEIFVGADLELPKV